MGSYTFKWEHDADEAYVTGTFDGWQKSIKLVRGEDGILQKTVSLPGGEDKIYYKFVVNNNWRINEASPHEADEHGNINNYLTQNNLVASANDHLDPDASSDPPLINSSSEPSAIVMGKKNKQRKQAGKQQQPQQQPQDQLPLDQQPELEPQQPQHQSSQQGQQPVSEKQSQPIRSLADSVPPTASVPVPAAENATVSLSSPAPATESGHTAATPSDLPGGFPSTPAAEKSDSEFCSINPMPAVPGSVNPFKLQPGEKVPEFATAQNMGQYVRLDKASYENSDALPGFEAQLPPVSRNMIPESSLPITVPDQEALMSTVGGPTATTLAMAGQVPLEPKVPEVVKKSQLKAGVSPEASAVSEEVLGKAKVEKELKEKVDQAPATSTGGSSALATEKKDSMKPMAAAVAAPVAGAAAAAAATAAAAAKDSTAGKGIPAANNAAAAASAAINKALPDPHKQRLPDPPQASSPASPKDGSRSRISPEVPTQVKKSIAEAGDDPEAATNTMAVLEKKEVESELLKETKPVPAASDKSTTNSVSTPAPSSFQAVRPKSGDGKATGGKSADASPRETTSVAAPASASAAAAAAAAGAPVPAPAPATSSTTAATAPLTVPPAAVVPPATVSSVANGADTKLSEPAAPSPMASKSSRPSASDKKRNRLSVMFSKIKEKFAEKK